jgi:hypothetical protein
VVVLDVNRQTLLNVRRKVAQGTLVHATTYVVLEVAIQIPLVRSVELAQIALDHGHRMIFDVLDVASLNVRYVVPFDASEKYSTKKILEIDNQVFVFPC